MTGADLARLLDAALPGLPETGTEDAVLGAACVIRHSLSIADAETLLAMTGLDAAPVDRCENCAGPVALPDHGRTCGPRTAERIVRLADSVGAAS